LESDTILSLAVSTFPDSLDEPKHHPRDPGDHNNAPFAGSENSIDMPGVGRLAFTIAVSQNTIFL